MLWFKFMMHQAEVFHTGELFHPLGWRIANWKEYRGAKDYIGFDPKGDYREWLLSRETSTTR